MNAFLSFLYKEEKKTKMKHTKTKPRENGMKIDSERRKKTKKNKNKKICKIKRRKVFK